MTTICYRDGVLASDMRAYSGDRQPIGFKQKIHCLRNSNGSSVAIGISTPHPGLSEEILAWFASEKAGDTLPEAGRAFSILEINDQGEVYFYNDSFVPSGPLSGEFFAIGTGAEYAIGAMSAGASAAEAVSLAGIHDPWTGGSVQKIIIIPQETAPVIDLVPADQGYETVEEENAEG